MLPARSSFILQPYSKNVSDAECRRGQLVGGLAVDVELFHVGEQVGAAARRDLAEEDRAGGRPVGDADDAGVALRRADDLDLPAARGGDLHLVAVAVVVGEAIAAAEVADKVLARAAVEITRDA